MKNVVDRIQPLQPSLLRVPLLLTYPDGEQEVELSEPGRAQYLVNRYTEAADHGVVVSRLP